jgi:GT2 family glycosyltransferase
LDLPSPGRPLASVLIPTARNPGLLERCLGSLAELGADEPDFETVVVLNGATRDVRATLERVGGVGVVDLPVNAGVAGALNRGRAVARGEFLVLLHDDAEVEPGWLGALVRCARERPEAGAVGSCVLDPDGTLQSAGGVVWRDGRTAPVQEEPLPEPLREGGPVDYCGTCSLLVPAAVWDSIGGADEALFPAYYVDADLCASVRAAGHVVWCEPASRVRHRRGASATYGFRLFVSELNRRRFVEKWRPVLERHELPGVDRASSVARALERARTEAQRARPRPYHGPSPPDLPPLDERALLRAALGLKDAYVAQMADEWDGTQRELERLHRVVERQEAELERLSSALRAIEEGGWWRLRRRLLPLLRRAGLSGGRRARE